MVEEGAAEKVPPALVSGDVGEGYAKYEVSVDCDRAHIAAQEDNQ